MLLEGDDWLTDQHVNCYPMQMDSSRREEQSWL
jgi:hypothetical protein